MDTSVSLPPMEWNIVDAMKKYQVNISLFELAKIQSQWDILMCTLGQTKLGNIASTSKGASTHPESLSTMINMLWMEE